MDWRTILIIAHIIGTALGVGAVTLSDLSFFRALRDGRLDRSEWEHWQLLSRVVWAGFLLLALSGFGFLLLYRLTDPAAGLIYSPKLWAKLTIVLVILVNGLVMHARVFPLFESLVGNGQLGQALLGKAGVAFTTGAISVTSWYAALILGAWRSANFAYTYGTFIAWYLAILLVAIAVANIIGRAWLRRSAKP